MRLRHLAGCSLAALLMASAGAENLRFVTESFQPFTYEEGGKGAGPIADIVQSVCGRIKAVCTIDVLPWRRALLLAEQGEADGIFTVLKVPEREKKFFLTEPVVETAYALFALDSGTYPYKTAKDLMGRTVGVYGPSGTSITLADMIKDISGVTVVMETDNATALRKLPAGRYGDDGIVMINRDVAYFLMKQAGIKNLRQVAEVKKIQYHIGLSRKKVNEDLVRRFNDGLNALIKEGAVKVILDKYGMKSVS